MNLVTWDPFRDLTMLQGDVNRLFERFGGSPGNGEAQRRWTPALDIHEDGDHFVVRCDLPGMAEQDVEIEVENRVLRIAGERRTGREQQREGYRRIERASGRFERMLTLPDGVDAERIEASFDRGVLQLLVPKPAQAKPRRIRITGAEQLTVEGAASDRGTDVEAETGRRAEDRVLSHA